MRKLVPDTLFARLFLLLFVVLTVSHFLGAVIFSNLDYPHSPAPGHAQPSQFSRYFWNVVRLAAAALAAWIAARWLSQPIRRMAQAANELGVNLDSPPLDESRGSVEVQQASVVFNRMQARLRQQLAERNRFLAAVSHDLRTPLTRLKLRAEKIEPAHLKAEIRADVDEMTAMIDATLDYLRGNAQPETTRLLDISALLHSMAEDAAESGISMSVSGNAQPVAAQPSALRRCLNNLIDNAVRYGNRAEITLHDTRERLIIAIQDTGPGLPADQLETVFSPFYRLETSRSRHTGGIGLGLSIARDIARQHGGDITLRNAPEGGLIAELTLPRARLAA
ncbi:MAG TPA: ATP-binding protein [Gallionellaceae bacterium]